MARSHTQGVHHVASDLALALVSAAAALPAEPSSIADHTAAASDKAKRPLLAAGLNSRRVDVSRSAFYARFTELVGEGPSRHLTRWRMRVAMDLMQRHDLSTYELAVQVGYSSEDSFARAFERTIGQSPSAWRRAQQDTT